MDKNPPRSLSFSPQALPPSPSHHTSSCVQSAASRPFSAAWSCSSSAAVGSSLNTVRLSAAVGSSLPFPTSFHSSRLARQPNCLSRPTPWLLCSGLAVSRLSRSRRASDEPTRVGLGQWIRYAFTSFFRYILLGYSLICI